MEAIAKLKEPRGSSRNAISVYIEVVSLSKLANRNNIIVQCLTSTYMD